MAEDGRGGPGRRKRKQRGGAEPQQGARPAVDPAERMRAGYAKAEERNREARAALEPLAEGGRPRAVSVGAIVSALIGLIFWVSAAVALLSDETVNGRQPNPVALAMFALIMTVMAVGMWRARYWAVLGFQMLLVLFLLAAFAGVLNANTWLQAIGTVALILACGTLFFFMVKAMARIQMPQRPGER